MEKFNILNIEKMSHLSRAEKEETFGKIKILLVSILGKIILKEIK